MKITLQKTEFLKFREELFGHEGVILNFKEGFITKKDKRLKEFEFYKYYFENLINYLPINFIPKAIGVFYTNKSFIENQEFEIELKNFNLNLNVPPFILMEDLIYNFEQPSILDIKLGFRNWGFNIKPEKKEKLLKKSLKSTAYTLNLKIRACLWYNNFNNIYPKHKDLSYLPRNFGNNCLEEDIIDLFNDFFIYNEQISYFIKKLNELINYLIKIKELFDIRFYSSSILFFYDKKNPLKFDCRLIDFGKTYFNVKNQFNETIEELEDNIINGIKNLINLLEKKKIYK